MIEFFKRWPRWWLGLSIACIALVLIWFNSPSQRLASAEVQWERTKPRKYRLTIESVHGFDLGTTVESSVQDGHIVSQVCHGFIDMPRPCDQANFRNFTVPDLFKLVQDNIDRQSKPNNTSRDCMVVSYNLILGNPTSITDDCPGRIDDEGYIHAQVEAITEE